LSLAALDWKELSEMTVAAQGRSIVARDVVDALALLRASGLRVTGARRLMLEALFAVERPVGAEEIAGGLEGALPCSDLASVYRNLDTLEQIGLVRHFHVAHGAGLYALAARHQAGYVACERCGAHQPLDTGTVAQVAAVLREACGYEPQLVHFPIIAHCPECRHAHS
jgi:Fur family transcriptional regulator, ferric uptake regulator